MMKTCCFTIVANNYRHFARALVASVRRHSPDIDAFVAICDDPLAARDARDAYTEIQLRELGLPKFDRFVFQYTILELNTAIKPWVIAELFDRGYERVIYFDPDIKLYGPLDDILAQLDTANIVLTPHLTDWLDDGKHPSELTVLQSGTYNLGFIALRASDEARRFVAWWQHKLLRDCVVDIARGLFTDQKWIDLVPGMYRGVGIVRDPGWNVAYWNLNHRQVTQSNGSYLVNGQPLLFFHYSGFAPEAKLFSRHQDRFAMDTLPPAVRALADDYTGDLKRGGDEECRRIPYAFGSFLSGEPIPEFVRRCYREGFPWDAPHPDLWTPEGQAFLIDWLNRPAPFQGRSPWFTRIAAILYRLRPDLQAAFPDVTGAHGIAYAHWFVDNARSQAGFAEMFIAPVRAMLGPQSATTPAASGAEKPGRSSHADDWAPAAQGAPAINGEPFAAALPDASITAIQSRSGDVWRRFFQVTYRAAWGVRLAVQPFTTQSFRHRVRDALLRRAYFGDRQAMPAHGPLSGAGGSGAAVAAPAERAAPCASVNGWGRPGVGSNGVNVIGYLAAESGVGESARSMLRLLGAAGIETTPVDFRIGNVARMTERIPEHAGGEQLSAINIFQINADQMFVGRDNLGAGIFEGRYNIGYWTWELPEFPDEWVPAFALLDEVWVPSAFCQKAIAAKSPVPVLRVPHAVEAPRVIADRRAFGFREDETVFLSMCDVLSVSERKNPFGAAEAFRRAFPGNEPVRLLLKISNLDYQPDLKSPLKRLIDSEPRITLIEGYLSRQTVWVLMASIDCYVSLHRSEGFGFGMAEAMACGKAVIATGWSGNVDFTRPDNSLLIDYELVALERDFGPYRRGQIWAEPDLDAAASAMRQIAASPDLRQRLGARGKEMVARELSPAVIAPMLRSRLALIRE